MLSAAVQSAGVVLVLMDAAAVEVWDQLLAACDEMTSGAAMADPSAALCQKQSEQTQRASPAIGRHAW